MTALKNKIKKIQTIVSLIENAERRLNENLLELSQEREIPASELLILEINTNENEFLFI
ncbi:hypothetical protein LZZ90_00220 [Flavobacterium sp. SM15]|uniref:hypothetical protein n=1 Tax=Flavobacterium sp. SM15 TaxID=2908005 RepID=UPI001EDAD94D|nr:hypothetical protein [Flavobacterium sp. SM15]MCG2609926.1 hypothetical protein [Flavobacterium sp. SM15]